MPEPVRIGDILRELRTLWGVDEDLGPLAAGVEDAWETAKSDRPVPSTRTARQETNRG